MNLRSMLRARTPDEPAVEPIDEPVSAKPTRLTAAHAALAAASSRIAAFTAQIATIERAGQPSASAVDALQSLHHRRQMLIAQMLPSGTVDTALPELHDLERQITAAEQSAAQSRVIIESQRQAVAELQSQSTAIAAHELPNLRREVAIAQFAAAGEEITERIEALTVAAAEFGAVYAELLGAGKAHCRLAQTVRDKYGSSVQAFGSDWPQTALIVTATGFDIPSNQLSLDLRQATQTAFDSALSRWKIL